MLFLIASLFSLLATQLFVYSTIIYIHSHNLPAWLVGAFYGFCFAPFFIFSIPIGKLADKVNKKHFLLFAHCGLAAVLLFAASSMPHHNSSGLVFLLTGAAFGMAFLFVPAFRGGLIAELYERAKRPAALIALSVITVLCISFVPLLHALLVSVYGEAGPSYAYIAFICAATAFYALIKRTMIAPAAQHDLPSGEKNDRLRAELFFCAIGVLFLGPIQTVLPKLITDQFLLQGTDRDLIMATIGVGMILSVPILYLINRLRTAYVDILMTLVLCAACFFVSVVKEVWLLIAAIIAACTLAGALVNKNQARIQAATQETEQGRVMSILALINMGVPALSGFFSGIVASLTSSRTVFMWLPIGVAISVLAFEFFVHGSQKISAQSEPLLDGD